MNVVPSSLADLVDGDDVRMVEDRGGARLLDEARRRSGSAVASAASILTATVRPSRFDGAIDDPHAAAADLLFDAVMGDLLDHLVSNHG